MLSTLADFQTKDLNNLLKVLRAKYDLYKRVNPDVQDEEVLNQFLIVKKILSDRKAFEPTNSILDTEAGKFQGIAKEKFGEPYAEVKSSDDGLDNGNPEITLEQIEPGLKSFLAASPVAWLVGGIAEQKSVKNDADFLISLPEKQELERIIKFRISRSFPFDIRDRLHFLCEQKGYIGAFTDNLPLYRLFVERIPDQEIMKMAEVRLRTKESGKYKAQAEKAIEKDEITPGEFYLPVKPVRGYLPGKEQTLGLFLDLYDTHYHYPALSSKKFDGMHLEIHKDGDKVTIFSEDGSLLEKLPELKKEITGLLPDKCVIEGELELWNYKIGQHLPRETVNPEVEDDSFYTTNIFECLYFEGKIPKELKDECEIWNRNPEEWKSVYLKKYADTFGPASEEVSLQVHRYPALIRFKFLEFLGIKQKTVGVLDAGSRLNLVEHFRCDNRKDLEKKTEELRVFVGSEGNVVSDASVRYHLTSGKRPYQMLKFHNSFTFNAIAVKVNETKTSGIYTVDWAVPSGMKTSGREKKNDFQYWDNPFKGDFVDIWKDPSLSEIYNGGRTFSTALKVKAGKTIKIECETFNVVRSHNDVGISAWSPRLLGEVDERPHTLNDLIESAIKPYDQNCIQFKMLMDKDWFVIDPEKNPNVYLNGKMVGPFGMFFLSDSDSKIISWNNAGTVLSIQPRKNYTIDVSEVSDVSSFAEVDSNPAIEEIKTKLKKLILNLLDLSKDYGTAKANSAKKIMDEIEKIRGEILAILIENKLTGVQLDDYILSPRKIPVIFEIKDEEALIKDLKSRKLDQFLFLREDVAIDLLKEYILQHEKDTDFKMPAGLEKSENRMALYMFRKVGADKKEDESGEIDHSELLRFYESPYNPSRESNEQLSDAWRLMCAHYATWKRTSGNGIVFSREEIIRNAVIAVKEVKERVLAGKMNHTFDKGKMAPFSIELYEAVKKELPDGPRDVGEIGDRVDHVEDGCTCQICGRKFGIDFSIPGEFWEKIKPASESNGARLLCPKCIATRVKTFYPEFPLRDVQIFAEKNKLDGCQFYVKYAEPGILSQLKTLAKDLDGNLDEFGSLPDGSGFAVMSLPLPKNHWLTKSGFDNPPMPMRIGTGNPLRIMMEDALVKAGRYAVRAATGNGEILDFDPDALVRELVIGMLGYYTTTGLFKDDEKDDEFNPHPEKEENGD